MSSHAIVERPGPLASVQDLGRIGGRRAGLAPGGAMDQRALLWANRLLDNQPGAAGLEVTLGGLALRFSVGTTVALTGADCDARLDGVPVATWSSLPVSAGQELRFGFAAEQVRAYIAFPGGLEGPAMAGSRSMVSREGLPGLLGHPLDAGSELRWHDPGRASPPRHVPPDQVPRYGPVTELPFFPGYEWDAFTAEDRDRVLTVGWRTSPASDRTATLLEGPSLDSGPKVLDSVPLVDGTVQVTGDGRPLVFMRDRPTIGGYAKLGSVDPMALDALAQARPGSEIRFVPGDAGQARRAIARRAAFFGIDR